MDRTEREAATMARAERGVSWKPESKYASKQAKRAKSINAMHSAYFSRRSRKAKE
jgi:hypothetical protein